MTQNLLDQLALRRFDRGDYLHLHASIRYTDNRLQRRYPTLEPIPPLIYVGLGVAADLSDAPPSQRWLLDEPLSLGGLHVPIITVRQFGYDPTLALAGTSVLNVMLEADYDQWHSLSGDRPRYDTEKEAVAEMVTAFVEKRFVAQVA